MAKRKVEPKQTHVLVVSYEGFDSDYDARIKDAFSLESVDCDGSGCDFGARDIFFYVYDNVDMKKLEATIARVKRWKTYKTNIFLDKFEDDEE